MSNLWLALSHIFTLYHVIVIFLLLTHAEKHSRDYSDSMEWQSSLTLSAYKSYKSVRILVFSIDELTAKSSWTFNSYHTPGCDTRDVLLYALPGSFPVINPNNESYPDNFLPHQPEQVIIHLKSDNVPVTHEIFRPAPATWFFAAFLAGQIDNKIRQQGFGDGCNYYLSSSHLMLAESALPTFPTGQTEHLTFNTSSTYRFMVTEFTYSYNIEITSCSALKAGKLNSENNTHIENVPNTSDILDHCGVSISTSSARRPHINTSYTRVVDCNSTMHGCTVQYNQPVTKQWSYIQVNISHPTSLDMKVTLAECMDLVQLESSNTESTSNKTEIHMDSTNSSSKLTEDVATNSSADVGPCVLVPALGRYYQRGHRMRVQYTTRLGPIIVPRRVKVTSQYITVFGFHVHPVIDVGLTARLQLSFIIPPVDYVMLLEVCLQPSTLPVTTSSTLHCTHNYNCTLNATHTDHVMYVPYPTMGAWYIAVKLRCMSAAGNGSTPLSIPCVDTAAVTFNLSHSPCMDGFCDNQGICKEYYGNGYLYSSCDCRAGHSGYACTDGSQAKSHQQQLLECLLLTLSNIGFMPAVVLAVYRRFYVEALVYFYTMLFSTMYHACDGDRDNLYCVMPYDVLSHCDFYGSILSFCVTLLCMADVSERLRSLMLTLTALMLAMAVTWHRHALWTFLVPCLAAAGIVTASWIYHCYTTRLCYPVRSRWLYGLLPGSLCALAGIVMFACLETHNNYYYIHSVWHVVIAMSIVFLLPATRNIDTATKFSPCTLVVETPGDATDGPVANDTKD